MDNLGTRLRQLRRKSGLSQRQLARITGVSNGTISVIEHGRSDPSVGLLRKILEGFGMSIADFFSEKELVEQKIFFPRGEFVDVGAGTVSYLQMGTSVAGRRMQVLREIYAPGSSTGSAPLQHEGEEAGIIMSGRLEVRVGDQQRILGPGDGYYFSSRTPHWFRAAGKEPCELFSACTPPF